MLLIKPTIFASGIERDPTAVSQHGTGTIGTFHNIYIYIYIYIFIYIYLYIYIKITVQKDLIYGKPLHWTYSYCGKRLLSCI